MSASRAVVAVVALVALAPRAAAAESAADAGPAAPGSSTPSADAGPGPDAAADASAARPRPAARPIPPERLPRVEAALGSAEVELGAVATLSIAVTTKAPGDRVHLRGQDALGPFEILDRRRSVVSSGPRGTSERLELDLAAFEAGRLEVPPVELMVVLGDGRTGSVSTSPLPLAVTDPLANEHDPQPRGEHPPIAVYTTDTRALWAAAILGGLLLAGLAGLLVGRLRARAAPKPAPPPPPPRPPEEVALEKLRAAEKSGMLERGEVKEFHVAVSEAVREYLGGRYRFDSLELTTEELIAEMDRATLRGMSREELVRFLGETDLVKFAKWRPDLERSWALLRMAVEVVHRTTEAERAFAAASVRAAVPAPGQGADRA